MKLLTRLAAVFLFLGVLSLTMPALAETDISITSPSNNSSQTASNFTISGTATPHRNIAVSINGSSVGSTTSDNSGNWSISVSGQSKGNKNIEVTASTQFLYANILNVGDFSASRMTVINLLNNEEEDSFSIFAGGAFPINWKPNPDFTQAYGVAPYLNSGTVWDMDLVNETVSTFTLPGAGQRGAALDYSNDGSKVFITDNANTDVIVYDTSDNSQIGPALSIGGAPHSNLRRPGTNHMWVLNSNDDSISVINTSTNSVIDTYATPGNPNGLAFSPDGTKAYFGFTDSGDSFVAQMDTETGTVTDTLAGSNTTTQEILTNKDGTRLYVSHPGDDYIDVFNLETNTFMTNVVTAQGAWGMALNDDDSRLYVTNPNLVGSLSGTEITIINTANNTVVDSIVPGDGAPFMPYITPIESASDTVSLIINDTASEEELADTGQNPQIIVIVAVLLIGSAALTVIRQQYTAN